MTTAAECIARLFPDSDNELVISGRPVSAWMQAIGRSPAYLYSRAVIEARVRELRARLSPDIHIHYAVKANPNPAVVRFLLSMTDGADVASAGELALALDAGAKPEHISFAGPGKRNDELTMAVAKGVTIHCESVNELARINRLASAANTTAKVAVRVNPDFSVRASGMKMGGGAQPFGIDAEMVPAVLSRWPEHCRFMGFHIFSGSQNLHLEAIEQALMQTCRLVDALAAHAPEPPILLNLGGGWGIPYFANDKPLALTELAEIVNRHTSHLRQRYPSAQVIFELGRFLVGEAGVYVCQIVDIKYSRGKRFYVVDGGLHHHLAASGNFGQVIRKNYPVAVINRLRAPETEPTNVVGPLCTPLDKLAENLPLPDAEVGDWIGVFQSGAYGLSASPTAFLSHPRAEERLL
ncbi:MAG: pyridoxal-dependent decarboxylase, exosortase A system-associated [Gammaproteobacteria bacterium]|nr:MAG: pyridoxal-dependent decarboxylase, exosortase A system-associated [Gammaproteobacteria bacterium]